MLPSEDDQPGPGVDPLAALAGARVVIWFCPDRDDGRHRSFDKAKPTVEWSRDRMAATMTPTCLVCGIQGPPR